MKISSHITLALIAFFPLFALGQGDSFTRKYAGTYNMLAAGQKVTSTSDKYVLKPDGKATWTFVSTGDDGKTTPTVKTGTWTAAEGLIHLSFSMGEGEGSEMISDFRFENGVFRGNEGIVLKKVVPKAKPK